MTKPSHISLCGWFPFWNCGSEVQVLFQWTRTHCLENFMFSLGEYLIFIWREQVVFYIVSCSEHPVRDRNSCSFFGVAILTRNILPDQFLSSFHEERRNTFFYLSYLQVHLVKFEIRKHESKFYVFGWTKYLCKGVHTRKSVIFISPSLIKGLNG